MAIADLSASPVSVHAEPVTLEHATAAELIQVPLATVVPHPADTDVATTAVILDAVNCEEVHVAAATTGTSIAEAIHVGHGPADGILFGPSRRAALMSVSLCAEANAADAQHGLTIEKDDDSETIRIKSIVPGSKFSQSPLRPGDCLLSINGQLCSEMGAEHSQDLLRLQGPVTIVAQNSGGDPKLVETMVEKPQSDSRVGLTILGNTNGKLQVGRVQGHGLFGSSLLNVGDRVLSINSVPAQQLDENSVLDVVIRSPSFVTILSEPHSRSGMVVSTCSCNSSVSAGATRKTSQPKFLRKISTLASGGNRLARLRLNLRRF